MRIGGKNMTDSIYLTIDGKNFEEKAKKAIANWDAEISKSENKERSMNWTNLNWATETISFENGILDIGGDLKTPDDLVNFGYLSTQIVLPLETVIDIIEFYMKKLGKLKTVLEATK